MALPTDLLSQIQTTLGGTIAPSLTTMSATNDLYEAYLFSLIIEAARAEGATIRFRSNSEINPSVFVFRTSPGYLNSTTDDYGYAEIEFTGINVPALEVHVGVRVAGHSDVLHESDVCVLLKSEAELCRRSPYRVAPRSNKVIIAVEAKCYVTSDIKLHLGRAFLGLLIDTSVAKPYFVINRNSDSVEKLLAHKKKLWEHNIAPSNINDVDRLTKSFQKAFRDYIAKYKQI